MNYILVGLGGFFGAISRYAISRIVAGIGSFTFPIATFSANILGAFAIGILSVVLGKFFPDNQSIYLLCVTGFLGGFTTFSTFSLETFNLIDNGNLSLALIYALISLTLCIAGVALGRYIGNIL